MTGPVEPDYGWAVAIPSTTDGHLYLHASLVAPNREKVLRRIGTLFAGEENWRKGWRKAYRNGYRAVRVIVKVGFDR